MTPASPRPQTLGEEIANSVSHGAGFLIAMAVILFAEPLVRAHPGGAGIVGMAIYGATMAALYMTSALYHGLPPGRAKQLFMKLDYCAIYVFIAGTYTPFTLGVLRGPWGWSLLIAIWTLALAGVLLRGFDRLSHPFVSTGLYLVMGWLVVIAAGPLIEHLPLAGLAWLVAGGLAYTAGVVFYTLDSRFKFAHLVWHLFVLAGSICHFIAVTKYA